MSVVGAAIESQPIAGKDNSPANGVAKIYQLALDGELKLPTPIVMQAVDHVSPRQKRLTVGRNRNSRNR